MRKVHKVAARRVSRRPQKGKTRPSKRIVARTPKGSAAVDAITKDLDFYREQRTQLQQEGLSILWNGLPESARMIVSGLRANKVAMYAGEAENTDCPDWYSRLQSAKMVLDMTIRPMVEKDQIRPPVLIVNALGGELGRMMSEVGFRGSSSIPLEMFLSARRSTEGTEN